MMERIEVIEAVQRGIKKASENYIQWSRGEVIADYGVESLMSAYTAESLAALFEDRTAGFHLTMETGFPMIEFYAKARARKGRKPTILAGSKRADIAIWNTQIKPIAVVELKRGWSKSGVADVERIDHLLQRYGVENGGTLQYGLVALLNGTTNADRAKTLEERAANIKKSIQSATKRAFKLHSAPPHLYDPKAEPGQNAEYQAVVVEIFGRRDGS